MREFIKTLYYYVELTDLGKNEKFKNLPYIEQIELVAKYERLRVYNEEASKINYLRQDNLALYGLLLGTYGAPMVRFHERELLVPGSYRITWDMQRRYLETIKPHSDFQHYPFRAAKDKEDGML